MNMDTSNKSSSFQNSTANFNMNQDLTRNNMDAERFKKIKNGTFYTEAVPSKMHYPCKADIPEPINKFIKLANTFDENETMNAEISNLNKSINKEK